MSTCILHTGIIIITFLLININFFIHLSKIPQNQRIKKKDFTVLITRVLTAEKPKRLKIKAITSRWKLGAVVLVLRLKFPQP